jgi:hypothetical protein
MTEIKNILTQRGAVYGNFESSAHIMQALKNIIHSRSAGYKPYQIEALEMICHKIGRILNGDPDYIDSWADIAGYAQLVVDALERAESANEWDF